MNVDAACRLILARNWTGSRSDKLHALIVAGCSFIATVTLCGLMSVDHLASAVSSRAEARSFAPVADGEDTAFERTVMYDVAPDGRGITVVLTRLTQQLETIPGLPLQPKFGWYTSPELQNLARLDRDLARRFPDAQEISKSGIARADELLAYRIVASDFPLNEELSMRRADYFGDAGEVDRLPLAIVSLLLLLVMGLVIRAALTLNMRSTRQRDGLFYVLGVSHGTNRWIRFFDAGVQALPGSVLAIALWGVTAPRLNEIPLVGRPVARGDLALGWEVLAIILCAIFIFSGVIASSFRSAQQNSRPAQQTPNHPSRTGAVFVVLGLATSVFASWLTENELRPRLVVTGFIISLVSLPWALPLILFELGNRLAQSPLHQLFLLVGRSIAFRSRTFSLGMTGLILLIALGPVASSWIDVARQQDATVAIPAIVEARGLDTVSALRFKGNGTALLFVSNPVPGQSGQVFAECSELLQLDLVENCSVGNQIRIPLLRQHEMITPVADLAKVIQGNENTDEGNFLFVSRDRRTEYELRAYALNTNHTNIRLYSNSVKVESVLVRWILGFLKIGMLLIALAMFLSVATQSTETAHSRQRLGALGLTVKEVRTLARTEAIVTYGVAGIVGALIGSVMLGTYLAIESSASLPIFSLTLVPVSVLFAICVAMWQVTIQTSDPLEVWAERTSSGW